MISTSSPTSANSRSRPSRRSGCATTGTPSPNRAAYSAASSLTPPLDLYPRIAIAGACPASSSHDTIDPTIGVFAECWKSVNGRPYQRWCDPAVDWSALTPRAHAHVDWSTDGLLRAIGRALLAERPTWMLPRLTGPHGAPSAADEAADAAARPLRSQGYAVEAFVDAPHRPAWRDRILRSAGYASASLQCTLGAIELSTDAGHRWEASTSASTTMLLRQGQSAPLHIGRWHAIRVVGDAPGRRVGHPRELRRHHSPPVERLRRC